MRLPGSYDALCTHVVLKHVDEGGVKLCPRKVVWTERRTVLRHLQLLTPLCPQKVQAPLIQRHWAWGKMLTDLKKGHSLDTKIITMSAWVGRHLGISV